MPNGCLILLSSRFVTTTNLSPLSLHATEMFPYILVFQLPLHTLLYTSKISCYPLLMTPFFSLSASLHHVLRILLPSLNYLGHILNILFLKAKSPLRSRQHQNDLLYHLRRRKYLDRQYHYKSPLLPDKGLRFY
jgi:hypothetical protein